MNASKIATRLIQAYLMAFSCIVAADDTEVFFGSSSSSSGSVSPNVLFILDTSSSMQQTDGLGVTRLDRMKEALTNILNDSNNINVGLMRFSNPGGPVLYPISTIDGVIETPEDSGEITARIGSSEADAEQASIAKGGAITLNANPLTIVELSSGGPTDIEVSIISTNNDVEQRSNGSMYFTSSDIEFMNDGGNQTVGLRFESVNIPQGATVTAASIEFEIDETKSGTQAIEIDITGHDNDSSAAFTTSQNDVSDRVRTTATVNWDITSPTPPVSAKLSTPDIASIIQEIVNRPGWSNNNNLTLIFEHVSGSGIRTVETYDGEAANAPKLSVTYDSGGGASSDNQIIGLHFDTIEVPQGATIESASIQFSAAAAGSAITDLIVTGQDEDDATVYVGTDLDITSRTYTTASVPWSNVSAFAAENETHLSPDLTTIVQEVVDRPGWCGGNSMNFKLEGSGLRLAKSYESDPSQAAYLRIKYDPDTVPASPGGCIVKEYSARVKASSDDAEESGAGSVSLSSSDLELVHDGSDQEIGIRFRNLDIEQGTTILSAHIEFTADESNSGATTLSIYGHDIDDSQTFTTGSNDVSSRTKTSASVSWSAVTPWTTLQAKHQSPDVASVMQEVVNRAGWASGNNMTFIITGSGERTAESYDGSAGEAPRLVYSIQGEGGGAAETTVRSKMLEIVDEIQYKSGTPIVDTLYEGALYFRGEAVDYGAQRGGSSSSRREHTRISHAGSLSAGTINQPAGCTDENLSSLACVTETITNGVYDSPIDSSLGSCQQNYIVLLTDGSPSVNTSAAKVKTLTGVSSCEASGNAECGTDLARFLYENDQIAGGEVQNVTTYTIGFNFSDQFIKDVASAGGGSFYEASTAAELADTFETIIKEILKTDTTFVAPGATVNQFNRLTHRNELYFSLFKPDDDPKWTGNLKKYRFTGTPPAISDKNNVPAIDDTTGFFKSTVTSFWSPVVDGNQVGLGGAASQLPVTALRNVYTWYNGSASTVLSSAVNQFDKSNTAITDVMLGVEGLGAPYRDSLMDWVRGTDVLDVDQDTDVTEDRLQLGDPLHSKPTLITYGGTEANPDITIFFGTNEGLLHAVDAETGEEIFSFIPEELLPNLDEFYSNSAVGTHPYGIDGNVVTWVEDVNGDNEINASDGDHAYIYFGMRRGGRNYYALDVTDRNNPKLMWRIIGGQAADDFELLGQTWSTPVKTKVNINGSYEDVLVFAGGYDPNQDGINVRTADAFGNAVFMVRAGEDSFTNGGNEDGAPDLIWSAGDGGAFDLNLSAMDYSMPASPKLIDLNQDNLPDQLYIGDMGGQLWRIDFSQGAATAAGLATGGVIADIAGATSSEARRFYHTPDVSLINHGGYRFLNIAIGSGYHAHPLDEVIEDRFYSFRQLDVNTPPASYTGLTEADLYDASANFLGAEGNSLTEDQLEAEITAFEAASGWFIKLENIGEKVLAKSLTVNNQVIFTSYEPNNTTSTGCSAAIGTSRVYVVSAVDAVPMLDMDEDGDEEKNDRSSNLATSSIAPEPFALIPDGADPLILIGPETPLDDLEFGSLSIRTYWYQKSTPN